MHIANFSNKSVTLKPGKILEYFHSLHCDIGSINYSVLLRTKQSTTVGPVKVTYATMIVDAGQVEESVSPWSSPMILQYHSWANCFGGPNLSEQTLED